MKTIVDKMPDYPGECQYSILDDSCSWDYYYNYKCILHHDCDCDLLNDGCSELISISEYLKNDKENNYEN